MSFKLEDLKRLVNRLNEVTNSPREYMDKETGNTNVGHFTLGQAYGGVRLERVVNECGAIDIPIAMGYETKKDAYRLINAYLTGIQEAVK